MGDWIVEVDEELAAAQAEVEVDEELAAVQAEVESRRAAEAAAVAAARPAHVVVPELTEGKTHHLFISHAEEDSHWVTQLVKILEEDRGLKCQWYKRDFKPGRSIQMSIQSAMLSCMKVLFIITPEFLDSEWCMREVDWATGLSVGERKCLVIPLLLKNCALPLVLKNFLYIDVPKGQDYIERIIRSFDPHDDNQCMIPTAVEFIPHTGSGLAKCVAARKVTNSRFRGTKWCFRDIKKDGSDKEINKIGSEFAADMYDRAREIANGSAYMRYFSLGASSLQKCVATFSMVAVTSLLFVLIGIIILYCTEDFSYTNYLHIVHWPAVIMVPVSLYIWRRKCFSNVRKTVWRLSLVHFKNTNILMNVISNKIQVMYYDVNPCLDYLTERLLQARGEDREHYKAQARVDAYEKMRKYLEDNMETFMVWEDYSVSWNMQIMFQGCVFTCH